MNASSFGTPRRPRAPRGGFVIGLVVFGGLLFLALAIYPTLFFSGSQTRSEALSANRWRGRVLARGGLKLGASLLRKERWWPTATGTNDPSIGRKTSEELGVPATAGRFELVAEAIIGPYPVDLGEDIPDHLLPDAASGGEPYNPLERVDLFVRAEIDDDAVVAYGAFVMSPRPRFHSTDSVMPGGSARLVRVQFFTGAEYHAIDQAAVRATIRDAVEDQADLFLDNYAVVNFQTEPSSQPTGPLGDSQATAFMEQWLRPGGADVNASFLRDRIYDALFEGTPTRRRPDARFERDLRANLEACSGEALLAIAEAQFCCENDSEGDCQWEEPACLNPRQWDYSSDDAGDGQTVLELREADLDDASVDAGYIGRMAATENILRDYTYSCDRIEFLDRPPQPSDPDEDWPARPAPTGAGAGMPANLWRDPCVAGDPEDACWCVNPQGTVSEPVAPVAYVLTDEVTGYEQRLDEVANYFRRQLLDTGASVDSGDVNFHRYQTTDPPPIVDDDDDDGGGDGDGDGGDDDDDTPPSGGGMGGGGRF